LIVDSSIIIGLLKEEADALALVPILIEALGTLKMSAANYLEAAIAADQNDDRAVSDRFDQLIAFLAIDIVPVTHAQTVVARQAYRAFGKGNHPARLNYGDCFAYALSRTTGEPLLFKGEDFPLTDVRIASPPEDRA
jgi:ribonuclease VapC